MPAPNARARCGGTRLCSVCKREAGELPMPDVDPEFATRQHLADAADSVGLHSLVLDGYTLTSLPVGDVELHAAWRELEETARNLEAAVDKVRELLPESSRMRRRREHKEQSHA